MREGIDGISLNPDAVVRTTVAVLEMEREQAAVARARVQPPFETRALAEPAPA